MARPRKKIDPVQVLKLASLHCTMKEMAYFFDVSVDTLERRYAEEIEKGREQGKTRLRQLQWQSAEKGIFAMQIWLGKQILGQSDKIESKVDSTVSRKEYVTEWGTTEKKEEK